MSQQLCTFYPFIQGGIMAEALLIVDATSRGCCSYCSQPLEPGQERTRDEGLPFHKDCHGPWRVNIDKYREEQKDRKGALL